MPFFFGSEHSGVACLFVDGTFVVADTAAEPLAAAGVPGDRALTVAAAGPAIPNIVNVAANTATTILRRSPSAFRVGSTEILQ
ncbi:hypothetical protein [Streptomyces gibsoniae]|uniref:Uncharacterized protein n=1 Tax=Streptomyces gibsoniae TaxID=3075529 RepID=A0ABU2U2B9_9ACTN|nr:hypothetical protein [Streptomyces sp. DSM 41699]MDT0467206.1 hypothetical protein [Streptomyces sp. DSM 41699]